MSAGPLQSFEIHEDLQDFDVRFNAEEVIPPDSATVSMAIMALNTVRMNMIAASLYDGNEQRGISITDLGAGSGILGMVAMATCAELEYVTTVDNDLRTLACTEQNLQRANEARQQRHMQPVTLKIVHGNWHDDVLWQKLKRPDLTISNPPYLLPGEIIRSGYELTPTEHLYAASEEELEANYAAIVTNTVRTMQVWDTLVVRLPKERAAESKSWMPMIYSQLKAGFQARGDEAYYVLHTHRFKPFSERPVHALTIEKLPIDYPAINPTSDVRVDSFLHHGKDPGILIKSDPRSPNLVLMIEDHF